MKYKCENCGKPINPALLLVKQRNKVLTKARRLEISRIANAKKAEKRLANKGN